MSVESELAGMKVKIRLANQLFDVMELLASKKDIRSARTFMVVFGEEFEVKVEKVS